MEGMGPAPKPFYFWCQHVIPLVFDDSLSYYEVLCKVRDYLNALIADVSNLQDFTAQLRTDVDTLQKEWPAFKTDMTLSWNAFKVAVQNDLNEMQATLDAIKNGEYVELYLDAIKSYIDNNLQQLVAGIVKYVVFGLNTEGRLVAYIPSAWQFLHFGTINDPDSELYGHLTLSW